MSIEATMAKLAQDEEMQTLRRQLNHIRNQVIPAIMCSVCSDPIGDEDFGLAENEMIAHERCCK